ncbi:MAG: hypothetical protein M3071_10375 [Actinomycetota bacterium]|nr:hypothetical protein [Actinomycetota bacterium]
MGFDVGRLRRGELVAGGGGVVLLVALFVLPWFVTGGPVGRFHPISHGSVSLDGWQALTTSRWVLLVTVAASIALVLLTASPRAPALPVVSSMLSCVVGGLSSLLLLYRLIDHGGLAARAGIYVGFVAALATGYGGYLSLRTEGSSFGDPRSIETVSAGRAQSGSAGRVEPTSAGRPGP